MSANAFMPSPYLYLYLYLYLQYNPLSLSTELYLMVHPDTLQRHTGVVINLFRLIYSLCCSQRFERNKSSVLPLPSVELSSQCHSAGLLTLRDATEVDRVLTQAVHSALNGLSQSFLTCFFYTTHRRRTRLSYCYEGVMLVLLSQTLQEANFYGF